MELLRLRQTFSDRCYLSLTLHRRPGDAVRLRRLHDLAQAPRVPTVVTGDLLFHDPGRRILQDVVTCIREGCTIDEAGFRKERFADRCRFSLSELRYQYPDEADVPGETPQQGVGAGGA